VSNYGLGRWRAAEAALGAPVVSNQVRYSLLTRRPERQLLPYAAAADRFSRELLGSAGAVLGRRLRPRPAAPPRARP
jgi:aryl-alcohol dehydrogenase-like predicted oxidoreductase